MPYRHAWIFVLGLLLLTVPAFWRGYWGNLAEAPWAYHVHGISASVWLILLIAQLRTIHGGHRNLHRLLGRSLLVVAPVFFAGGLLVMITMSNAGGPFYAMYGDRLAAVDAVSLLVIVWLLYRGVRLRRNVHQHATCLLLTAMFLVAPTVGRIIPGFVPGLTIRSLEDLPNFGYGLHISHALTMSILAFMWLRVPRARLPIGVVAVATVIQSAVFETLSKSAPWAAAMDAMGMVPLHRMLLAGVVTGALVLGTAWRVGTESRASRSGASEARTIS